MISRNPAGLSERESKELSRPRGIMIAAIDLGIDTSIGRNLNDLAVFQAQDPTIHKTVEAIKQRPTLSDERYLLRRDILYSKDSKSYPNWRPVLPSELEKQVTDYVHTSLQHLGTDSWHRLRTLFM
jgi:hypothetical protein